MVRQGFVATQPGHVFNNRRYHVRDQDQRRDAEVRQRDNHLRHRHRRVRQDPRLGASGSQHASWQRISKILGTRDLPNPRSGGLSSSQPHILRTSPPTVPSSVPTAHSLLECAIFLFKEFLQRRSNCPHHHSENRHRAYKNPENFNYCFSFHKIVSLRGSDMPAGRQERPKQSRCQ